MSENIIQRIGIIRPVPSFVFHLIRCIQFDSSILFYAHKVFWMTGHVGLFFCSHVKVVLYGLAHQWVILGCIIRTIEGKNGIIRKIWSIKAPSLYRNAIKERDNNLLQTLNDNLLQIQNNNLSQIRNNNLSPIRNNIICGNFEIITWCKIDIKSKTRVASYESELFSNHARVSTFRWMGGISVFIFLLKLGTRAL